MLSRVTKKINTSDLSYASSLAISVFTEHTTSNIYSTCDILVVVIP